MAALFLGGHPAIDFLNTRMAPQGVSTELIGDGQAFLRWLVDAGLLDEAAAARAKRRLGAAGLDEAAHHARTLREWTRSWLGRWREAPDAPCVAELRQLNTWLARGPRCREVVVDASGPALVERCSFDGPEALVAVVAAAIAALYTTESASLLKQCAGPGCSLSFLDRSKGHRRLFCSAAACGNRAKVAAFRERQRAQ